MTSRSRIWVSPVVYVTRCSREEKKTKKQTSFNVVPDMHDEIETCPHVETPDAVSGSQA